MSEQKYQADVVIVGGGLAGLTAAYDLISNGKKVILLDRDDKEHLGGLAKKSFNTRGAESTIKWDFSLKKSKNIFLALLLFIPLIVNKNYYKLLIFKYLSYFC